MPVEDSMFSLTTVAASNSPRGSDVIGTTLDDYLRSHATILRRTQELTAVALRGRTGSAGDLVYVQGANAPGDGGAGLWRWDATSTATDNLGAVLTPTGSAGAGRWVRNYAGNLSVRWFGATGDGATDDTTALAAALAAATEVCFPDGDYLVSSSLSLRTGHHLTGVGQARLKRDTSVAAFDMLVGVSAADIIIDGLWLDGVTKLGITVAANRYSAIRLWDNDTGTACERIVIRNCRFDKTASAEIQAEGVRGAVTIQNCDGVEISGCKFYDNRATCIFWYDGTQNVNIHDCYCQGEQTPYDPLFQRAGSFVSGQNTGSGYVVADNIIEDTGYSSINATGSGVAVTGNVIRNPAYSGIALGEVESTENATIANNTITGPGFDGITIFPEATGVVISGNSISDQTTQFRAGIHFFEKAAGDATSDVLVIGNTVYDCYAGIQFRQGNGITIKSNLIYDCSNAGIKFYKSAAAETPQNVSISDNTLESTFYGINFEIGTGLDITGNRFIRNQINAMFLNNDSGAAAIIYAAGNLFFDNNYDQVTLGFAILFYSPAADAVTLYLSDNTFISTAIATRQPTAIGVASAAGVLYLGNNTFSPAYDISAIQTTFASRSTFAIYKSSGGTVGSMKILSGSP